MLPQAKKARGLGVKSEVWEQCASPLSALLTGKGL